MRDGLEDVIAAETMLSDVDGVAGRLIVRGHSLDEIAGRLPFEAVTRLLLDGMFDGLPDEEAFAATLAATRMRSFNMLADGVPHSLAPVDSMRALLATVRDGDDLATALTLLAAPATILPAIIRAASGKAPVAPSRRWMEAGDILHMLHGRDPHPAEIAALDTYLVTVVDHGLNASTFTARVVASTGAGLTSSALAALGALKGPLHGGAPGPVLDMLDQIGTADRAESWIADALARGERLMGFGHRIYRVRDPRADALRGALERLKQAGRVNAERLAVAEAVEDAGLKALRRHKPDRVLETNVEFYTAVLLETLGFPREAFTGVFAIGRMAGWIAHSREQTMRGRLIRPRSLYVGPMPLEAA